MLGELRSAARSHGVKMVEYTTRAPADATRYARGISDQAGAVIVWGGDGTVNEVAAGLAGSDVAILPCRAGTENLLAKELRIPKNPEQIMDTLCTGRVTACDIGKINGQSFLMIVGIGFDGEVVHRLTATRSGHISHLSYFWPIWRTFWEHEFPRMRVVADGEEIYDERGMAFVGNIARYATGLRICRDAQFDDGQFDLVIFSCKGRMGLVCHAARTVLNMHSKHSSVLYRRFRHLRIETDGPVPCQVDGDVGPDTPAEISVSPEKIHLIIPQDTFARRETTKGDQKR